MFPNLGYWFSVKDGDPRAFALYRHHYSYHHYKDGRRERHSNPNRFLIVGPGEKMVLLGIDGLALFVWRKFIDDSGQRGVNCAVFRNESDRRSSDLILEAEHLARGRWPHERLYTYVNPTKVQSSNPGFCFRCAGWHRTGHTKSGLVILAK